MIWWKKTCLTLVFILGASLVFVTPSSALSSNNMECVETGTGVVCPDHYCAANTIACDPDGSQCYCQPQAFGELGTRQNSYCEIATGSKIWFTRDNSGKVDKITLSGGIWSGIIDQLVLMEGGAAAASHDIDTANRGIIFHRKDEQISDSISYYSSNFLSAFTKAGLESYFLKFFNTELGNFKSLKFLADNTGKHIGMGLFAEIKPGASSGHIFNPTFEYQDQKCGLHVAKGFGNFFHKLNTTNSMFNGSGSLNNACIGPSILLADLVFPSSDKDGNVAKAPLVTQGFLGPAQLTRNCVGLQPEDNYFIVWLGHKAEKVNDPFVMISNLIVPSSLQRRPIYQFYQENNYMGVNFPANESAEARREKTENIQQLCNQSCSVSIKQDYYSAPPFCKSCNLVINLLKNSPQKSYSDIIRDEFSDESANCRIIDASFGNEQKVAERANHPNRLDNLLPSSLRNICQTEQCKQNALKFYVEVTSPELQAKDVCSFMDQDTLLAKGKWIFCPVLKTETLAADHIQNKINDIFAISTDTVAHNDIFKLWIKIRNVANILLIIVLLMIIMSQITGVGFNNYQIKKALPRVVVATILVNLSFILSELAINLSNTVGAGIADFFNHLTSGLNIAQTSFNSQIFNGSGNILIVAAVLALGFPLLLTALVSVVTFFFLMGLRKFGILLLVALSPLIFVIMVLPNGQNLFNKWRKMFTAILLLYPSAQLLYSASIFTKALLQNVRYADGGAAAALIPLGVSILPFLAMLFIPIMVKNSLKGMGNLVNKIMSGTNKTAQVGSNALSKTYNNSFFAKGAIDHGQQGFRGWLSGDTLGRRRNFEARNARIRSDNVQRGLEGRRLRPERQFRLRGDNFLSNFLSGFSVNGDILNPNSWSTNRLASGVNSNTLLASSEQIDKLVRQTIGKDQQLLSAFIQDGGEMGRAYNNLTQLQQQQFRLLSNYRAEASTNAVPILAEMGVTDRGIYTQIFSQMERAGVDQRAYNRAVTKAYVSAKGKGDLELMGFLKAQMTIRERDVIPSTNIRNASSILATASPNLLDRIIVQRGSLHLIPTSSLSGNDRLILGSLMSQGLSEQEVMAATLDILSRTATPNRDIIQQGLAHMGGLDWDRASNTPIIPSSFTTTSDGDRIDKLNIEQSQILNYAARTMELVNQNLNNNNQEEISLKQSGFNLFREKEQNDIINNTASADNLPSGWRENRSLSRLETGTRLHRTYDKEVDFTRIQTWGSQIGSNHRQADINFGGTTTTLAREQIHDRLTAAPTQAITDVNNLQEAFRTHPIRLVGESWHYLAPGLRNIMSDDIINTIYNTMDSHGLSNDFGLRNIDDARRMGAEGMMRLIGIESREIRR